MKLIEREERAGEGEFFSNAKVRNEVLIIDRVYKREKKRERFRNVHTKTDTCEWQAGIGGNPSSSFFLAWFSSLGGSMQGVVLNMPQT